MKKRFSYFLIFLLPIFTLLLPFNISTTYGSSLLNNNENYLADSINDNTSINLKSTLNKNNNYPIFFVHGLFGWGNAEFFNINYWGGTDSLKDILSKEGYTVYTPTIGPISSNWDRACELYAYIVGGTVDYGEAHSEKYGHARYGRTYPGVYTELSDINKIHLLGHSLGGQTIRLLASLLENGDTAEIEATGEETSELFKGGHHFVESITTLATPHDGCQLDEMALSMEPTFHSFLAYIAAQTGSNQYSSCLDLKMDQWGLKQEEGESIESYYKRVLESNIWQDTTDLSFYDISLDGAKEFNTKVSTLDDVYYFSIACSDTHKVFPIGFQVPNSNMNPLMKQWSRFIGCYTRYIPGKVTVTKDWWENDGVVSVRSAISPHEGGNNTFIDFSGTPTVGTWNYLGEINNVDHLELCFQFNQLYRNTLQNTFKNIAKLLYSL